MTIELAISFAAIEGTAGARAERTLALLPGLADGALLPSDLAMKTSVSALLGIIRLDGDALEPQERLRFWCARAGGSAVPLSTMPADRELSFRRRLDACDVKRLGVPPFALRHVAREILSTVNPAPPAGPAWPPMLVLEVGGPAWSEFHYDGATNRLFVPASIGPALGDALLLELRTREPAESVVCRARVASVRPAGEALAGRMPGFLLALAPEAERARAILAASCSPAPVPSARASPRFPVTCPVRFKVVREGEPSDSAGATSGTIRNLSQGGAFVRTDVRSPAGTSIDLWFEIGDEVELATRATVVHANATGMGIRFDADERFQAYLSQVLARLSGRPRRVLVVDDDALSRGVLAGAFEHAGFDVLTAPDALCGLQVLVDEMLSLDLLVTDVVMEGIDGVELLRRIRHDGNETELPILAVTASVAPELEARLLEAGADAVASKSIGTDAIVQAGQDAIERCDRSTREPRVGRLGAVAGQPARRKEAS